MEYWDGVQAMAQIQVVVFFVLVWRIRFSTYADNLARVGWRESPISALNRGEDSDLGQYFLIAAALSLGCFLSWLGIALELFVLARRLIVTADLPIAVREPLWKLKNVRMPAIDVADTLLQIQQAECRWQGTAQQAKAILAESHAFGNACETQALRAAFERRGLLA